MDKIKFSEYINIVKPEYVYLKLTPNNSLRNNGTHKIAKAIASLYKSIAQQIKVEEKKLINFLGKEFIAGTKFSYEMQSKVSYYIYINKSQVDFFFIIPKKYLSIIKEKISDAWDSVTMTKVNAIPAFNDNATKYQMVYTKEDALSLSVDKRSNELLRSKLNVIDIMEGGDQIGIFYNFIPISQFGWINTHRETIEKVKNNKPVDRNKLGVKYAVVNLISFVTSIVNDIASVLGSKSDGNQLKMFESAFDRLNGRKQIEEITMKKGSDNIISTQIIVLSQSDTKLKQLNNAKSISQSFNSISEDNTLVHKSFNGKFDPLMTHIQGVEKNKVSTEECSNFIQIAGRDLLERYNFIEKIETNETQVPDELKEGIMRLGESTHRGNKQQAYLSNDDEFQYLSLVIVGPNRSGKSTFIGNLAKDGLDNNECVINFDFIGNCELSDEISELFPEKVLNIECNKENTLQGLGYNEIPESDDIFEQYTNAKLQTSQTLALINSINTDDVKLSSRMSRYLQSASNIVAISRGSINDVFEVLQDHVVRMEFIRIVPEAHHEYFKEYIEYLKELNEYAEEKVKTKHGDEVRTKTVVKLVGTKHHLVSGIIDRLDKLKENPYMELMLKESTANNINLVDEFQKNQIINIRMPETMFTTDNEKDVYTTYWATKIWLALQIRKAKYKENRSKMKKVNLFIDELYQVENTERFIKTKLSRLPKFNIKPIFSCHYLNQLKHIRTEFRSASASYMLISGCDKDNFKEFKEELYPFELDDLLNLKRHHSLNLIKCKNGYGKFITHLPGPISEKEKDKTACLQTVNSDVL